jgi:hypothetical protein
MVSSRTARTVGRETNKPIHDYEKAEVHELYLIFLTIA